ncbi:siderophore-interacting protein [Actinoplanes subtropicus]|uniref:siderophore-interacting protein n=1 Tax=Actinoplanes subtropicus TaxID=543632 RepID=UPI0007C49F76|nr:siderophore-interacting protein [Actinoplanes subtropicus]
MVVVEVGSPTPRTVRVVVQGDLADWPEPGAAAHTKVFLPDTPSGPVMRTYTVRHFHRAEGLVTIDFLLNPGLGPATQWAARVVPGMRMELGGRSRSAFSPDPDAGRYLFAGDESALPAIATCLESLPASAHACVIAEIPDEAEAQSFTSPATVTGQWVLLDGDGSALKGEVIAAARAERYDRIWVACEAATMRAIRRALLDEGVPTDRLTTRGYWKRGESDHSDHDTGADVS